ncbi:unnamed protein product [Porites lobata]|uniref:ShKT domain-containing protein n=1 Tax=Porites lobata TaxID=104759 RepID=A0ABN8S4G8_9CNID|nr:unnamed protein product [Porites lobata]
MRNLYLIFVVLSSFLVWGECRAVSRECRDNFHNCETWRRSGLCHGTAHAFYLRNGCAKTCGFCKSDTPLQTNQHSIQDTPKKANKQSNKGIGQGQQKLHSPGQVPLPSDLSLKSGKEMPEECTDRFVSQTCKQWKDGQMCMDDRYRNYLTYGCASTCRFCNCRDTYRESPYCDAWKSKGFCKQYKDQLDTYCPKTCGFCINAKYEETTVPPQNTTAPTPSQSATPPSSDQEKARPVITVVKNVIQRHPVSARFANTGKHQFQKRFAVIQQGRKFSAVVCQR